MSLMGIDVGTTRCKAAIYNERGETVGSAGTEYDIRRPTPSEAELDAKETWEMIKDVLTRTVAKCSSEMKRDPVSSIAVASLGEATVPVTEDGRILGPSILNSDARGEEYLPHLESVLHKDRLYRINGNVPGNHYSLTKLLWIKEHRPDIYRDTYKFLHWGPFVSFMLGAEPAVDYSLANRTLLFDINREEWSGEIFRETGLDSDKMPDLVGPGSRIGAVSDRMAAELGLPRGVSISAGAHDQCANALGCGVVNDGDAMCGMGTVVCIAPVFSGMKDPQQMMSRGLNTEHHAVAGRFVSFIYNQGGCLVKWFCDTFLSAERAQAEKEGDSIYDMIFDEMPESPGSVVVLPHFDVTGPPEFITDSSGVIAGLKLHTRRGDILKGIIEGSAYYLRECVESLPGTGIEIKQCRAVGGGSRSDSWVQLYADIFNLPFTRPAVLEAGTLGAAMLGGMGNGTFASTSEAVAAMVREQQVFEPDAARHAGYDENYRRYRELWPVMKDYLRRLT